MRLSGDPIRSPWGVVSPADGSAISCGALRSKSDGKRRSPSIIGFVAPNGSASGAPGAERFPASGLLEPNQQHSNKRAVYMKKIASALGKAADDFADWVRNPPACGRRDRLLHSRRNRHATLAPVEMSDEPRGSTVPLPPRSLR